eukprot:4326823-Prymnesium_polylepis.1
MWPYQLLVAVVWLRQLSWQSRGLDSSRGNHVAASALVAVTWPRQLPWQSRGLAAPVAVTWPRQLSSVTVPGSATRLPSPTDLDSSVASQWLFLWCYALF